MLRRTLTAVLVLLPAQMVPAPATAQVQPAAGPGTIEIIEPQAWQTGARGIVVHDGESVRVRGFVNHPDGVDAVYVDDDQVSIEMMQDGRTRFLAFIPNPEGAHEVTVAGVSSRGERFARTYTLEGTPRPSTSTATEAYELASSSFSGERFAVVIGVSDYSDEQIPDLQYAHRDALSFAEFLRSPQAGLGGFPDDRVFRLTNQEATLQNMKTALYRFLDGATENDVVYIYFAGHGVADPNRPEDLYLLPYDARIDDLPATAFPMRELEYVIDRTRARDVILITDACHSGGIGAAAGGRAVDVNLINEGFLERLQSTAGGRGTITSSRAGQISQEGPQWGGGHGVFTYHLIAGLRGAADTDGDHIVSYRELFEYVRSNVQQDTGGQQVPQEGLGSFDGFWPMSIVADADELAAVRPATRPGRPNSTPLLLGLLEREWFAADSLVSFVGIRDTVVVHFDSERGDVVPPEVLTWRSGNEAVATVDASGVVRGIGPGFTSIQATAYDKRLEIPVRVFEAPVNIQFNPRGTDLHITRGQDFTLSASVELPGGRIVTGLLPLLALNDTLTITPRENGIFSALREGETSVSATLAGQTHTWSVTVSAPLMSIDRPTGAVLLGDTLDLRVRYLSQDGTQLGEALLVSWESSDPEIMRPTVSGLVALAPGRVVVTAAQRSSQGTLSLFVLGDLIIAVKTASGSAILTVSLSTGERYTLLNEVAESWDPSLSPDGTTIAFASTRDGRPRIWLMDADGRNIRRLAGGRSGVLGLPIPFYQEHEPVWSHDGTMVHFISNNTGNYEIYSTDVTSGTTRRLTTTGSAERGLSSAPDVPRMAFERVTGAERSDVFYALSDGSEVTNFTSDFLRRGSGSSSTNWMASKPALLAGGQEILVVEVPPDYREGESLTRYNLASQQNLGTIVSAQKDSEIVYAVSPRGDLVAYNQRSRFSGGAATIVITQLDGVSVMTIALPQGDKIESISWGAVKYEDIRGGS